MTGAILILSEPNNSKYVSKISKWTKNQISTMADRFFKQIRRLPGRGCLILYFCRRVRRFFFYLFGQIFDADSFDSLVGCESLAVCARCVRVVERCGAILSCGGRVSCKAVSASFRARFKRCVFGKDSKRYGGCGCWSLLVYLLLHRRVHAYVRQIAMCLLLQPERMSRTVSTYCTRIHRWDMKALRVTYGYCS